MSIPKTAMPRLETGDRLTRAEFHRRYEARPDIRRAELIDGVVYVASPTRFDQHDELTSWMVSWAAAYAARHPDVRSGNSASLFLGENDEVQPDAFLFLSGSSRAGARPNEEGCIEGAPQLVVEVAASSAYYDLHTKLGLYRRSGVLEYVVWRVLDDAIDWFRLQDGEYVRVEPDENGMLESAIFPGLRLPVAAMIAGDMTSVFEALGWTPR
jgi:Uma2 family endonuclease